MKLLESWEQLYFHLKRQSSVMSVALIQTQISKLYTQNRVHLIRREECAKLDVLFLARTSDVTLRGSWITPDTSQTGCCQMFLWPSIHFTRWHRDSQSIHTYIIRRSKVQADKLNHLVISTNHNADMEGLCNSTFIQWNNCIKWNH